MLTWKLTKHNIPVMLQRTDKVLFPVNSTKSTLHVKYISTLFALRGGGEKHLLTHGEVRKKKNQGAALTITTANTLIEEEVPDPTLLQCWEKL